MAETMIFDNIPAVNETTYKNLLISNNNTPRFTISFIKSLVHEKIQLTPTAIRILFKLITFTDVNGKVHGGQDFSEVEATMVVRKETFFQGLERLFEYGFIISKNEGYFLSPEIFTVYQADLASKSFVYFDNYEILQDEVIMGQLSLNDLRLLLHLYANRSPQMYSRTRITNLYKNNFVKNSKGLDIFDSFQDLVKSLSKLAYLGVIDLKLSYSAKYCTLLQHQNKLSGQLILLISQDMSLTQIETCILNYYERNTRKKLGNETSTYFILEYRMPNKHYLNKVRNQANYTELRLLCDAHNISFDEIKDSAQLGFVVGHKNILYKLAGEIGLSIYDTALNNLFKDHEERVATFVALEKLANVLVDYYILPAIEDMMVNYLESKFPDNNILTNLIHYYHDKVAEERLMLFVLENDSLATALSIELQSSFSILFEHGYNLLKKSYSTDMEKIDQSKIMLFDEYKLLIKDVFITQKYYDSTLLQVHLDNQYVNKLRINEKVVIDKKVEQFNFAAKSLKNTYKNKILEQELIHLDEAYSENAPVLIKLLHDKVFVRQDETPMSVDEIFELTEKDTRALFKSRKAKIQIWANEYLSRTIEKLDKTGNNKVAFYNWLEERD